MAKAKKNKIEVKLIKGNNVSKPTKPNMHEFKRLVMAGEKVEKAVRPALLISRLDYPVDIAYGEAVIRLSPRGNEKVGDVEKIKSDQLPNGVFLKKIALVKKKK